MRLVLAIFAATLVISTPHAARAQRIAQGVDSQLDEMENICDRARTLLKQMTNYTSMGALTNTIGAQRDCALLMQQMATISEFEMTPDQKKRFDDYIRNHLEEIALVHNAAQQRVRNQETPEMLLKKYAVEAATNTIKMPTYIDCTPSNIVVYPGKYHITASDLAMPSNRLFEVLSAIQENNDKEYVIFMVRPASSKMYRALRQIITNYNIDVEYDAVDSNFVVYWPEDSNTTMKLDSEPNRRLEENGEPGAASATTRRPP